MIDIILSLLEAQKGKLIVDDKIINKDNCRQWQKFIGYVPQHIFLIDLTIVLLLPHVSFHQHSKTKE